MPEDAVHTNKEQPERAGYPACGNPSRRAWLHTLALVIILSGLLACGGQPAADTARQPTRDPEQLRMLLKTPGVHAIIRHALAPGNSDPAEFRIDDCATQRNLDDRGRDQARAIGRELTRLGARFDQLRTSQWCRCRETARLLNRGNPVDYPVLNSFYDDRSTADQQTRALKAFLHAQPRDKRVLFVTHQVNITALTGRAVGSGELFLISIAAGGQVEVVGILDIQP